MCRAAGKVSSIGRVVGRVLRGCDNHHSHDRQDYRYHSERDELERHCDPPRGPLTFAPIQRVTGSLCSWRPHWLAPGRLPLMNSTPAFRKNDPRRRALNLSPPSPGGGCHVQNAPSGGLRGPFTPRTRCMKRWKKHDYPAFAASQLKERQQAANAAVQLSGAGARRSPLPRSRAGIFEAGQSGCRAGTATRRHCLRS